MYICTMQNDKNNTMTITTNGATTEIVKTINVQTLGGLTAQLTLSRKIIAVGLVPHKTDIKYGITYKGQDVNSYELNHKEEVRYFLNHLDKYANRF